MVDSSDWTPTQFIVERPFFFAIQDDETGAILFAGVVVEPM
jgi:serine protease inhibitor